MSRTYEMMFILRPDLTEELVTQQTRKYANLFKEHGAEKVAIKVWGKRRLAYPIQKFQDGIYILANYTGDGSQVAPVERAMRLSEEVIRYLTIKLRKDIEIEDTEFSEDKSVETPSSSPSEAVTPDTTEKSEATEVSKTNESQPVTVNN
jgi:small subunit ribosomal protein S6